MKSFYLLFALIFSTTWAYAQNQMDLPVTFDDATVNYSTIDFGGNTSSFVTDPAGGTNMVVQVVKDNTAQLWAGTTLAVPGMPQGSPNDTGFVNVIPFSSGNTTMSVRVYSPDAGIPVRLKVEDAADDTHSVETEAMTTVANAWDTLVFDFSNEATGTAAINFSYSYDKASIFFNFGTDGATAGTKTYYFDDVMFGGALTPPPPSSNPQYCDSMTYHFQNPAEVPSAIFLTITNTSTTTMDVIIESADMDTADLLIVTNGSGAAISAESYPSPGKISRTLTWTTPPTDVDLNILWSKNSFGGNWQLSTSDITVSFADTCGATTAPPPAVDGMIDFSVDMRGYTGSLNFVSEGVFINGVYNGWCGSCNPMSDVDGDSIYTATLLIPAGQQEFKYTIGGWNDQEALTPGDACVLTTGANTNRIIDVNGDAALDTVCWNACTSCASTAPPAMDGMIDFSVDMRGYTGSLNFVSEGVFINGAYNGWCGSCNPMSDVDGDSIYTATLLIPAGQQEFKYTIGGWNDQEALTPGDACVLTTGANTNRIIDVNGDAALDTVCWNACTSCASTPPPAMDGMIDFAVDMRGYTGALNFVSEGVFINGAYNGWCGSCNPMSDVDGDSIYTATLLIPAGQQEFKYTIGGWNDQEALTPGDACVLTTGANTNRIIDVNGDAALDTVCWNACVTCDAPTMLAQMDLPVTFEDTATVNYGLEDFGGNASMLVVDPTDPSNLVVQTIKDTTAQLWAGTSLDEVPGASHIGFVNAIPFTATATTMSIRVWSPVAGIPVRLKAENSSNNTITVETEAMISAASTWETLVFDFSNQATGTAALDLANSYDLVSVFFDFGTDGATAGANRTYYWDDVEFGGTASGPCSGVSPNPLILEDFECQENINFTFANATWTEDVANPDMTGINTSSMVGEFIHWGAGTDGAFGGNLNLGPIDISTDNLLKVDVWTNASALPITMVLQDGAMMPNELANQTATTTATGMWHTIEFDMSAAASSTDVSNIVFVINPGSNDQDTVYIDNVRFEGSSAVNCAGVTPDQDIFDDFECQGNINYTFANATWTEDVANPNPTGINTSAMVGEFIHWGAGTDGAFGGTLNEAPVDLTNDNQLKIDVHTNASALPITVVLQDASQNTIAESAVTTSTQGAWETLTFDMKDATDASNVTGIVIVVNPGSNVQDTVYFDNIRLDGFVADPCETAVPNKDIMEDFDCQRNIDYQFAEGGFLTIANPDMSGINTSASVGQYTRNNTVADAFGGDFTLAPLDFASNNQIKMNVWDANAPSEVTIVLQDASGSDVGTAVTSTTTANAWEDINFDFSSTPDAAGVSKVVILFGAGEQADSNQVYYFDNLRMEGFAVGITEIDSKDISVYPNPAQDNLNVDVSSLNVDDLKISVISVDGKVLSQTAVERNTNIAQIDISNLSLGFYIIEVSTSTEKHLTKFIKN